VAKSRKVSVVDGYTALKAVKHAVKPADAPAAPATPAPPSDLQKLGAHVGRTVVPAKHVIECYECGYKFQLHGRAETTNCSKCRATLDLTDHTIDGKWTKSFKTCGLIHLTGDGVLQSGDLVGNDVIVEGTIEAGTVRALRRLELRAGARFSEHNLQAPDLLIAAGATIAFVEPAEYRDVEIAGTLRANLHATSGVSLRATGRFNGQVQTPRLLVEDGAELGAGVKLGTEN
jgi:cytoskeletal protein CcmA (bactofilin family)